ncbi:MAG: aminoacyl-tRNA hydrolase [Dehalococcoidia bacterium]|nr:aminoacyl-tRNA hydrolase [Dehalococcoidia bacterium]
MRIIMGLGNPGRQYQYNRHNVGFHCIDRLAEKHSIKLKTRLCQSQTGTGQIEGAEVVLAKPSTFVNLSGNAAAGLLKRFGCTPQDLIVIHDDLDLPAGRIRVRLNGRSGGHRGIKSIIHMTGSQDFHRVRIGISRPFTERTGDDYENEVVDYVLGDFSREENELIQPALDLACDAVSAILKEGIAAAMNKFNRRR